MPVEPELPGPPPPQCSAELNPTEPAPAAWIHILQQSLNLFHRTSDDVPPEQWAALLKQAGESEKLSHTRQITAIYATIAILFVAIVAFLAIFWLCLAYGESGMIRDVGTLVMGALGGSGGVITLAKVLKKPSEPAGQ